MVIMIQCVPQSVLEGQRVDGVFDRRDTGAAPRLSNCTLDEYYNSIHQSEEGNGTCLFR